MSVGGAVLRSKEIEDILSASHRAGVKVVVLIGPAGAGKSWLAHQALTRAADEGVLVGAGKYGEAEGQSALGPVIAALSALLEAALDRFFVVQTGLASLTEALGVDLDVLIGAGLTTAGLAAQGELTALPDRRGGAKRIAAAAASLLSWLDGFGAPRMIVIDDWRRASPEGLELIRAMANLTDGEPLTIVLTQREPAWEDDLGERVEALVYRLNPLDDQEVSTLLASQTGSLQKARLVQDFFGEAVPRLPFHLIQATDALDRNAVWIEDQQGWALDKTAANRLDFDALTRIKLLSPTQRDIVTALAIWGDSAPLGAFRASLGSSASDPRLKRELEGLREDGIVDLGHARIAIRHDLLRRAALDLAPTAMTQRLAGQMAERLPRGDDLSEVEITALHLRRMAGLADAAAPLWCARFVKGAAAARGRNDMAAAASFAEAAFTLRERGAGLDRATDRQALREAVLAAADRDDPHTVGRAQALIATARSMTEVCDDYQTAVTALRFAGQSDQAWRLACEGLRRVGIAPPPSRPGLALTKAALKWLLQRRGPRRRGNEGGAERLDAFTRFAAAAAALAYHRDPLGTAIIGFEASTLASRRSLRSAYWRGVDAFLFAALGLPAKAAQAGERALESFSGQRVMRAMTLYQAVFFGVHWGRPLKSQRSWFPEVTRLAYGEGDLLVAAYGLRIHIMSGWRTCENLDRLLEETTAAHRALLELGEASFSDEMASMVTLLQGLTGRTAWDPAAWRTDLPTRNHVIDLELSNLAGDFHETLRRARLLRPLRRSYSLQVDSVVMRFHEMLASLRCGFRVKAADLIFLRRAARLNPADHRPKLLLLEAERLRQHRAKPQRLMAAYATAVEAAMRSDSRLDASLTTACAAHAAQQIGDRRLANAYRAQTETILRAWGLRAGTPTPAVEVPDSADAEARAIAAERADHAKSQLLIHVAHELRTPLQALQTMLDVAAPGGEGIELSEVRDVLASLKGVVDDLNINSNLAEEAPSGEVLQVNLAEVIRSEMGVWRSQAQIVFESETLTPPVDVASDRLRQIVRNLLSNAVKYGDSSPINVSLAAEPAGEKTFRILIGVRDHGPGIMASDFATLFEPFQRGVHTGDGKGAGLGLALSRRIVERMGGTLTVENHPEGGAVFRLSFLAQRSEPLAAPAMVPSLSILLVEDVAVIRRLLQTMLTGLGHTVVEAPDAASAIAACGAHRFDLFILDMGLPDASGLSVVKAQRNECAPSLYCPTILLTASTSGEAETFSRSHPLVRVLRKPASASRLAELIGELMGVASSTAASETNAEELAKIDDAAKTEIIRRAMTLLEDLSVATPEFLHQLAGLSAQFNWPEMTKGAEALAFALAAGKDPAPARKQIEHARGEIIAHHDC